MPKTKRNDSKRSHLRHADDNTKNAVLQVLKKFKGQRIPKHELVTLTKSGDRAVRDAISQLRKEGVYICNAKDGLGYWLGTKREYDRYVIADYKSRIQDIAETVAAFYGMQLEGQVSIDELLY